MFPEIASPYSPVGSCQLHVHIVRVPPDINRDDGDSEVDPSSPVRVLVAVFDIVESDK